VFMFPKKTSRFLDELIALQKNNPEIELQQFENRISASQYSRLYELIQKFLPCGSRVLDWGCGNGHFSFFLLRFGYDVSVFSLDNRPPVLIQFGQALRVFVQGDKNDPVSIPFPENSFDAVVSVGVLEHVRETSGDETASLAEIRRILRPGGFFFGYHIPNAYSWIEALSAVFPKKHSHRWRYKQAELKQILSTSGLAPIFMRRYGFLPRWLSLGFPPWLKNSRRGAGLYNFIDIVLGRVFFLLCTNHAVVAQKKAGG
jgi:SAM-dependent methyltransferase